MNKKLLSFFLCIVLSVGQLSADSATQLFHRAEKNLTRVIVHDIFSPPVASRIYLYANIAAYETIILQDKKYHSLKGQVAHFPQVQDINPTTKINYPLAAVYAFLHTGEQMVFSEHLLKDSLEVILADFHEKDKTVYENSIGFGKILSDSILHWSEHDNYLATRKKRRYNYSKTAGKWTPTPPGYIDAVEPYWSLIRPVSLDSAGRFKPVPPPPFDTDTSSRFMQEALEVYRVSKNISKENVLIASFWDCNPFYLNTQGHLNFATKKLSPGGHWISITGQVARLSKLDLPAALAAYVMTSIALFDGFISCWDEKYRSQFIRPETIINAYIDEKWRPMLQTPPFPEYTSGHSVISTAVAIVLTDIFGDNFAYNDDTEVPYGLPVRKFKSFRQACDEAAISRLYGGIHYRAAIEQGQIQGQNIGKHVVNRIRLRP